MTQLLTRNRAIGLALAAVIFTLDQWVKALLIGPLELRQKGHIDLSPFFDFTWTQNFGVSLGMLTATSMEMRWILVGVTAAIALMVLVWIMREKALADILALGLVLGGAIGNISDRTSYGFVVDYADFHIGSFRPFMIFNLADAAITIGFLIILARSLFLREKREHTDEAPETEPAPEANEQAVETAAETN